jgi:hypothetical protein
MRTIDIPPFLDELIGSHLERMGSYDCACSRETPQPFCSGGSFAFLNESRKHARRSDFSRRFFRPAADGCFPEQKGQRPRPATPVLADVSASWPGVVVPAVLRDGVFVVPSSRGVQRRPDKLGVNSRSKRDELISFAVGRGMPLSEASELTREQLLDRFVRASYRPEDPAWGAMWMPVKQGLTPHGLRHGHETWMAEDKIADVLRDERMGHIGEDDEDERKRSMRDRYTHISNTMVSELLDSLQRRWEQSLVERVELEQVWHRETGTAPASPVGIVNEILKPYRDRAVSTAAPGRITRRLQPVGRNRRRIASA